MKRLKRRFSNDRRCLATYLLRTFQMDFSRQPSIKALLKELSSGLGKSPGNRPTFRCTGNVAYGF
jgi:hypothetical protein